MRFVMLCITRREVILGGPEWRCAGPRPSLADELKIKKKCPVDCNILNYTHTMTEERPKFERCLSTLADCADHVDSPRSPQQSQDPQQETEEEQTSVDLANELIADVERSLNEMTNVVHNMATGIQHKRMIELSVDMYDCLKLNLELDLSNLFGVARAAAKYSSK